MNVTWFTLKEAVVWCGMNAGRFGSVDMLIYKKRQVKV